MRSEQEEEVLILRSIAERSVSKDGGKLDLMDRTMDKTAPHPLFKLATELGPLLVFFFANGKFNLFIATGAFMVAVTVAMVASYVVTRHVPMMAIVTAVVVIVFGTLTLVLHDETFIKMKPTIVYSLFAVMQMPLIKRYHLEPASLEASEAEAGDVTKG